MIMNIMNGFIDYEAPETWTVELEPSATLANSYIDGGNGFIVNRNRESGENFWW